MAVIIPQSHEFSISTLIEELFIPENHQMNIQGDIFIEENLLLEGNLVVEI